MNVLETAMTGFAFADRESEENCRKALAGDGKLIVINSNRSGSGKTALARRIFEARGISEPLSSSAPLSKADWDREIPAAIERGYLFLDDVATWTMKLDRPSKPLERAARWICRLWSAKQWKYRKRRSREVVTVTCDLFMVITGNCIKMAPDLSRRAIVINLA